MPKSNTRTTIKNSALGTVVIAAVAIVLAALSNSHAAAYAFSAGMLLSLAYELALVIVWIDGKPMQTRGGVLTKEEQRSAYIRNLLLMSLLGWVALLVFGSNLIGTVSGAFPPT